MIQNGLQVSKWFKYLRGRATVQRNATVTDGWRSRKFHSNHGSTENQGYRSIGSFHSDDLGHIMSMSDEQYNPPPIPFESEKESDFIRNSPQDYSRDFMLDRQHWTFLNHGAFGGALQIGYDRAEKWRLELERQPLRFFDREVLPHLAYATRRLAKFCGSGNDPKQRQGLTLLPNATSGLNSVLKGYSQKYKKGHVILWDTSYGSVKTMANHYCGENSVTTVPLQSKYLPQMAAADHPEHLLQQAMEDTMSSLLPDVRSHCLIILDHTTSNTALNMPIENMTNFIKKTYGSDVLVVVDGAHGLLAHDINLDRLDQAGVDIYISNGHKWLACPRGVGMLYCPSPELQTTVLATPVIVSHGSNAPDLLSRFVWDGCRDYAAALALPVVLDYWEDCLSHDPVDLRTAMKQQLLNGIQILADHLHSKTQQSDWLQARVTLAPPSMFGPMALVRLPSTDSSTKMTSSDAKQIQDFLYHNRIEVPIKCINDELYVRVSCHVYNELEEFDRLGKVLLT